MLLTVPLRLRSDVNIFQARFHYKYRSERLSLCCFSVTDFLIFYLLKSITSMSLFNAAGKYLLLLKLWISSMTSTFIRYKRKYLVCLLNLI
jgi:hypothetical protein